MNPSKHLNRPPRPPPASAVYEGNTTDPSALLARFIGRSPPPAPPIASASGVLTARWQSHEFSYGGFGITATATVAPGPPAPTPAPAAPYNPAGGASVTVSTGAQLAGACADPRVTEVVISAPLRRAGRLPKQTRSPVLLSPCSRTAARAPFSADSPSSPRRATQLTSCHPQPVFPPCSLTQEIAITGGNRSLLVRGGCGPSISADAPSCALDLLRSGQRAFRVSGNATLELRDLSVSNGLSLQGSVALALGPGARVTATRVRFTNHTAFCDGGVFFAVGGASVAAVNCSFAGSRSGSGGGAIGAFLGSEVEIAGSEFTRSYGGACGGTVMATAGSALQLFGSRVNESSSNGYGGGVCSVLGGRLHIAVRFHAFITASLPLLCGEGLSIKSNPAEQMLSLSKTPAPPRAHRCSHTLPPSAISGLDYPPSLELHRDGLGCAPGRRVRPQHLLGGRISAR